MAVTIEKGSEAPPAKTRKVRSARWAWVALLLAPVGLVLGTAFQLTVFHGVSEQDVRTTWEIFSWVTATCLAMFAAPLAGIVLGLRAARSGNRSGYVAAGIGVAMLPGLIFLSVAYL